MLSSLPVICGTVTPDVMCQMVMYTLNVAIFMVCA
jgi:hypothetical protein